MSVTQGYRKMVSQYLGVVITCHIIRNRFCSIRCYIRPACLASCLSFIGFLELMTWRGQASSATENRLRAYCISRMEGEQNLCLYFDVGFDWEPCKQLIRSDLGCRCCLTLSRCSFARRIVSGGVAGPSLYDGLLSSAEISQTGHIFSQCGDRGAVIYR